MERGKEYSDALFLSLNCAGQLIFDWIYLFCIK